MAIEDAAALGILFSKEYFRGDVQESLAVYEKVRLPRATKVQASAAKAASNINERIGMYLSIIIRFGERVLTERVCRLLEQHINGELQG